MRTRLTGTRLGTALREDLSPAQVLVCAAVMFAADWAYQGAGSAFFPGAPLDEVAHVLTALLLLQALPSRRRASVAIPALIASVAIDLDHVPQYLGYDFLTVGTPRPYTHSLLTALVLLALAVALQRHRSLFIGLTLGIALHFFRDLAEGNGSGVCLLWPLSHESFSYPHAAYLAMLACVVAADLALAALSPRARAAVP